MRHSEKHEHVFKISGFRGRGFVESVSRSCGGSQTIIGLFVIVVFAACKTESTSICEWTNHRRVSKCRISTSSTSESGWTEEHHWEKQWEADSTWLSDSDFPGTAGSSLVQTRTCSWFCSPSPTASSQVVLGPGSCYQKESGCRWSCLQANHRPQGTFQLQSRKQQVSLCSWCFGCFLTLLSRNFGKSKSFDRREDSKRDKNYLRVDQGSRASKRVHIRRSSSVEIIRPKRLSSGAKDIKNRERRKRWDRTQKIYLKNVIPSRLGTDTSSGSNRSKKTNSSSSSVQKHLPKYIQSLFRSRMGTDPCKRTSRSESTLPHSDFLLCYFSPLQTHISHNRHFFKMLFFSVRALLNRMQNLNTS